MMEPPVFYLESILDRYFKRGDVRQNRYSAAFSRGVAVPRIQGRFSWAGIRGRGARRRQDGPSVQIEDIHFFSGRQKTSSSISIFGQILNASRACDYLDPGKV